MGRGLTLKQAAVAPLEGLKRLTSLVFRRYPSRVWSYVGSAIDWQGAVGNGTSSSTVMAPLLWIARTFPEAPPALFQQLDNGQEDQVRDHPMLRLLQRPNQFYTGRILWMATITDWSVDGNAYWLKLRNGAGVVKELWWAPSGTLEPRTDSEREFITHYEYSVEGRIARIEKEDVIHFRNGMDPDDPRKGYSPLKSVLREVYTDDEAAAFTATLLKNMGVPGLVVSPKNGSVLNKEQAGEIKADVESKFNGDNRGATVVMTGATDIEQYGFSPEQMLLREIRRIPEERVTAVLGVPAIVAGLGAGLDRSTFTNMSEAREMAYESNIIPSQGILGEDVRFQLLTEFVSAEEIWSWRFGFDLAKVRVLQEDVYRQAQRLDLGVRGSWVRRSEARRHIGLEVDEGDDVYLVPMNAQFVPAGQVIVAPAVDESSPKLNGNGNGAYASEVADEVVRRMALTAE